MKLELLSVLVDVHGDVITIVHLFLHKIIYFFGDFRLVPDLPMQSLNPFRGTIEVLTQFFQFLSV